MGDRVNVRAYGEKVATSVVGQLRPKWQELSAKASELEAAKRAEREARAAVDDQNKRLRPIVDALRPLNEGDRKVWPRSWPMCRARFRPTGRRRFASATRNARQPGQTATRTEATAGKSGTAHLRVAVATLRLRVGGAAFGHQSGGFFLRLDEGDALDEHHDVIGLQGPELGGRGRLMASFLQ